MVSKLAVHPSEYTNRVVVNWLPLRLFSHTNCGWINPKMVLYNKRKLFNTFNHKMLLKQSIIWKSTQGSCNSRLLYLLRTNIGYGRSNSIAFVHISAPSENRDFAPPPQFWNNSYWWRGFLNNRSRLLIGRELALLLLEECLRCFNCMHWHLGLYTFNLLCYKKCCHKMENNQSCLKLPEMARKLVENVF